MSSAGVRVGVGTRFRYDGETVEVIEMAITATGNEVVLKDHRGRVMRLAVKELLLSDRAQVIPYSPGPSSDDDEALASVVVAQLSDGQREALLEKAAHIRELLTGYRSGSAEVAEEGEPRPQYAPDRPLYERYADKAAELGVGFRTIERWVQDFRWRGEAGLVSGDQLSQRRAPKVDDRWVETALEIMGCEARPGRLAAGRFRPWPRAWRQPTTLSCSCGSGPSRPSPASTFSILKIASPASWGSWRRHRAACWIRLATPLGPQRSVWKRRQLPCAPCWFDTRRSGRGTPTRPG